MLFRPARITRDVHSTHRRWFSVGLSDLRRRQLLRSEWGCLDLLACDLAAPSFRAVSDFFVFLVFFVFFFLPFLFFCWFVFFFFFFSFLFLATASTRRVLPGSLPYFDSP